MNLRQKRNDFIRQNRREDINKIINGRRFKILHDSAPLELEPLPPSPEYLEKVDKLLKCVSKLQEKFVSLEHPHRLEEEVSRIRVILNEDENFPIAELLGSNLLDILMQFFDSFFLPHKILISETLWILLNVVCFSPGYDKLLTYNSDQDSLVKSIFTCLYDTNPEIKKNAVWLIHNLIVEESHLLGNLD